MSFLRDMLARGISIKWSWKFGGPDKPKEKEKMKNRAKDKKGEVILLAAIIVGVSMLVAAFVNTYKPVCHIRVENQPPAAETQLAKADTRTQDDQARRPQ